MQRILNSIILKLPFRSILRRGLMALPTQHESYSHESVTKDYLGYIKLRGIGLALAFVRADGSYQFDW